MNRTEKLARYLVVVFARHGGRSCDGVSENLVQLADERSRFQDIGILEQGRDGRIERTGDRATLLLLGAGQEQDEVGGCVRILGISRHRQKLSPEGRGILSGRTAFRKGRDADLVLDRTVTALRQ